MTAMQVKVLGRGGHALVYFFLQFTKSQTDFILLPHKTGCRLHIQALFLEEGKKSQQCHHSALSFDVANGKGLDVVSIACLGNKMSDLGSRAKRDTTKEQE